MIVITMFDKVGTFASNKDIAKEIRTESIMPALESQKKIIIDFQDVDGATQSFIHALISDGMRKIGAQTFLDVVTFKTCNDNIKAIITIVTDYMQAGLE